MSQQIDDRPSVDPGAPDPRRTGRTGVREAVGRVARQLPAFLLTLLRTIVDAVGRFLRRWVPKVRRYVQGHPRGVLIAVAAAVGGYLLLVALGSSTVAPRTTVAGVDIGGLTAEQAQTKLAAEWSRISQTDIAASAGATSENLPRSLVTIDPRASVAQVTTNRWAPWDLPRAWSSGAAVPAVGTIDEAALRTALEDLGRRSVDSKVEPAIVFEGTKPTVKPGKPGADIQEAAASKVVLAGVLAAKDAVVLPTSPAVPAVSDGEAEHIAETVAVPAVAAPVTFRAGGATATASPADIAAVLSFRADRNTLVPEADGTALLARIGGQIPELRPAANAKFEVVDGQPQVTPSQPGRAIAPEQIGRALLNVITASGEDRKAQLDIVDQAPNFTTDAANSMDIHDQLSTFTQNFEPAEYRTINIGQAARRIDGKVLQPGEVFSMNDTVGERTKANGYTEGLVVGAGNSLEKEMGGGVSTATTAMWTAAFFAGLEKVEQGAHTLYIPRYTPGLEATVAWGRLDLKFRNDTGHPILIRSEATDHSVTMTIYGTKVYDRIDSKIRDSRFRSGSGNCSSAAGGPFDVSVDRIFIKDGAPVKTETFTTHYEASLGVKCDQTSQ